MSEWLMTFPFMMDCFVFCEDVTWLFCHMIDGVIMKINCLQVYILNEENIITEIAATAFSKS